MKQAPVDSRACGTKVSKSPLVHLWWQPMPQIRSVQERRCEQPTHRCRSYLQRSRAAALALQYFRVDDPLNSLTGERAIACCLHLQASCCFILPRRLIPRLAPSCLTPLALSTTRRRGVSVPDRRKPEYTLHSSCTPLDCTREAILFCTTVVHRTHIVLSMRVQWSNGRAHCTLSHVGHTAGDAFSPRESNENGSRLSFRFKS